MNLSIFQTFYDIKGSVKNKESNRRKNLTKTGGGPLVEDKLDYAESSVIELIGNTAIQGLNVPETVINFENNLETLSQAEIMFDFEDEEPKSNASVNITPVITPVTILNTATAPKSKVSPNIYYYNVKLIKKYIGN